MESRDFFAFQHIYTRHCVSHDLLDDRNGVHSSKKIKKSFLNLQLYYIILLHCITLPFYSWDVYVDGNFWLGLEAIHDLTAAQTDESTDRCRDLQPSNGINSLSAVPRG